MTRISLGIIFGTHRFCQRYCSPNLAIGPTTWPVIIIYRAQLSFPLQSTQPSFSTFTIYYFLMSDNSNVQPVLPNIAGVAAHDGAPANMNPPLFQYPYPPPNAPQDVVANGIQQVGPAGHPPLPVHQPPPANNYTVYETTTYAAHLGNFVPYVQGQPGIPVYQHPHGHGYPMQYMPAPPPYGYALYPGYPVVYAPYTVPLYVVNRRVYNVAGPGPVRRHPYARAPAILPTGRPRLLNMQRYTVPMAPGPAGHQVHQGPPIVNGAVMQPAARLGQPYVQYERSVTNVVRSVAFGAGGQQGAQPPARVQEAQVPLPGGPQRVVTPVSQGAAAGNIPAPADARHDDERARNFQGPPGSSQMTANGAQTSVNALPVPARQENVWQFPDADVSVPDPQALFASNRARARALISAQGEGDASGAIVVGVKDEEVEEADWSRVSNNGGSERVGSPTDSPSTSVRTSTLAESVSDQDASQLPTPEEKYWLIAAAASEKLRSSKDRE